MVCMYIMYITWFGAPTGLLDSKIMLKWSKDCPGVIGHPFRLTNDANTSCYIMLHFSADSSVYNLDKARSRTFFGVY